MVLWEIRKGAPAFFGSEDHADGSKFWQDLSPTTSMVQEWFSHCPCFRKTHFFLVKCCEESQFIKQTKTELLLLKGDGWWQCRTQSPILLSFRQYVLPLWWHRGSLEQFLHQAVTSQLGSLGNHS